MLAIQEHAAQAVEHAAQAGEHAGGFDAGETIIHHVANSSLDDPLIHLPRVLGIDLSGVWFPDPRGPALYGGGSLWAGLNYGL